MSTESDFDKIYSRTVKPSYSKLKKLWETQKYNWLHHLTGNHLAEIISTTFDQLWAEEQFAFWAWTRENKEELK